MTQFHQWFQELQVARTIKALKKNNFDAMFFAETSDALAQLWKLIPEGATVGVGTSLTLHQIGFYDEAQRHPIKLLNPFAEDLSSEKADRIRREIISADFFICSSNAITEDGKLYNLGANGNRVGSMVFGPKKVILICGTNKIVKDIAEAHKKVQECTAPMNAKRLGYQLPCSQSGRCSDCSSPERICNVSLTLNRKPRNMDYTILIVGEFLGL